MEVIGYFLAIVIGLVLGLIGGGGSILSVPVCVYLFGFDALTATTYSLFVVGITSMVGTINYFKAGLVKLNVSLLFGLPSVIAVILVRKLLLPTLPENMLEIGSFVLTKNVLILLLFATLMLFSAIKMIRKSSSTKTFSATKTNYFTIILQGLLVGSITGLIGAGGGFLIIPALVMLVGLSMKEAIGTSLFIITLNSLIGFGSSANLSNVDWSFLLTFSGLSIIGMFMGLQIGKKIDGKQLKPAFGWFVLITGLYIILKETLF